MSTIWRCSRVCREVYRGQTLIKFLPCLVATDSFITRATASSQVNLAVD